MIHASNEPGGADLPPSLEKSIATLEQEYTKLYLNMARDRQQVHPDRIDRMALVVLGTLSRCGPARLSAVAEKVGFDPSTVSRQVADLERAGLLSREPDPDDGRAILLQPTDKGRSLMQRLHLGRRRRFARMLSDWSADDIHTFGLLLVRMNEAVEKYSAEHYAELEEELRHG